MSGSRPGIVLLLAAALLYGAADADPGVASHTVVIENMMFTPARMVVRRGERVLWVNKDLFAHTATAAAFDSGGIAAGSSWSYTASKSGDYAYACILHPTMKGELKVE